MDHPGRDCKEEKTVTVRNGMFETKLRTDGSGAPLLFLHGAGGLRGWDTFLVELAKDFTAYAPAHPGFETSTGIEHIDDMLDMVVYYNDLLDALLPDVRDKRPESEVYLQNVLKLPAKFLHHQAFPVRVKLKFFWVSVRFRFHQS